MSGFVGMSPEGFLLCPKCGDQWHAIACADVSNEECDCPTSCARTRPNDALVEAD